MGDGESARRRCAVERAAHVLDVGDFKLRVLAKAVEARLGVGAAGGFRGEQRGLDVVGS
jgi:hypothetical protein